MIVGIVPSSLIARSGRLDANFYIGHEEENRVERAKRNVIRAKNGLRSARMALIKRNAERRRLGVRSSR